MNKRPLSLLQQILWRIVPLVILLLLVLTLGARHYVVQSIRHVIQQRLQRGANLAAANSQDYIEFVADACRAAAENDVVVNGIIDADYRAAVTDAFIRSVRLPGRGNLGVALADYRGRPLVERNGSQLKLLAKQLQLVMSGMTLVVHDRETITFAVPVMYSNRPEAVLITRYSLADFLAGIGNSGGEHLVAFSQDETFVGVAPAVNVIRDGDVLQPPEGWLMAASVIPSVSEINVVVLESEDVALRAAGTVTNTLMVTMGIVILASLIVVAMTSRLTVGPTVKLLQKIDNVRNTGDLSQRVEEEGAREFVELSKNFNAMLAELQHSTVSADKFRKSEERLSLALEFGRVGLWDWNVETGYVFYSESLKQQLGYDPDDGWNHSSDWEFRLHPNDRSAAVGCVERHFEDPSNDYVSTFRLRCSDGSYRWIKATGRAEFDDNGKPVRMLGVHVDIHSEVEYELSLEQSNQELEQFAYVASHDLQEPLRKVSSFCELLEAEYKESLSSDGVTYLRFIVDGAKRMQTLIRDLLLFSRVKSDPVPFQSTLAIEAVEQAIDNLELQIDEANASVCCDDLPAVWANTDQLVQVFQNLIGNGVKYNDSESPKVRVTAVEEETVFVFRVRDNGIGMEREYHERIFGIFKRLHSQSEYPGTGIGLAICRRIVEQWGGRISLESNLGQGSTFSFTVPKVAYINAPMTEAIAAQKPPTVLSPCNPN